MDATLHKLAIAEIDREIAGLDDQIRDLQTVRSWHESRLVEHPVSDLPLSVQRDQADMAIAPGILDGLTQVDAIKRVFQIFRRPLRPAEIVSAFYAAGFKADIDRGSLLNSTYTSMMRKPQFFEKKADSKWTLLEMANGHAAKA